MNLRDKVIAHTIDQFEGGFSDRKADRGGPTKYGITRAFLADYRKVPVEKITRDDIYHLTLSEATNAYRAFWDITKTESLPEAIRHIYFDVCINSGQQRAVKILQKASGAPVDGKLGPNTIACAKAMNPNMLLKAFVHQRIDFYERIVVNDPTQLANLKGWENRANWFLTHRITADG